MFIETSKQSTDNLKIKMKIIFNSSDTLSFSTYRFWIKMATVKYQWVTSVTL